MNSSKLRYWSSEDPLRTWFEIWKYLSLRSSSPEIPWISTNLRLSCVTLPPLAPWHEYTNVQRDFFYSTTVQALLGQEKHNIEGRGGGEVMRRVRTQHSRSREHPKMKIEKIVIERHSVQPLPPTVQLHIHSSRYKETISQRDEWKIKREYLYTHIHIHTYI